MIVRFSSIRSKVWLCVLTALAGFFISILFGFYINLVQYDRLSHMQNSHWPLVSSGDRLLSVFQQQSEKYEDAFLLGEDDLAQQAISLQVKFLTNIDSLLLSVQRIDDSPVTVKELLTLKQDYLALMKMAIEMRPNISAGEFSAAEQKKIQQFGKMQQSLEGRVEAFAIELNRSMLDEMDENKGSALYNLIFLMVLFFLGLLAAILTVNRVAGSLLLSPLSMILSNVRRLESGQELEMPAASFPSDEIGRLATAFWHTGEKLRKTTVSKRYVDNILSNMSGGLVVVKPDLTIDKVSQQTSRLFGYREQELLGQPIEILIAPGEDSIISSSRIDELLGVGIVKEVEMTCMARDGMQFPAQFSGSAMYDVNGDLTGIIGIFTDITELKKAQNELIQMAHHDALTGLPNRYLFFDRLVCTLQDAKRHNRIFALLYLDLDKFKEINDSMGHDVGDMVLKEVSNRLLKILRADDTVARMGGDEFLVILNGLQSPADAQGLADKVIQGIAEPFTFGTVEHRLSVSAGISIFPQDGTSIDTLIKQSDTAMYLAKHRGANRNSSIEL